MVAACVLHGGFGANIGSSVLVPLVSVALIFSSSAF